MIMAFYLFIYLNFVCFFFFLASCKSNRLKIEMSAYGLHLNVRFALHFIITFYGNLSKLLLNKFMDRKVAIGFGFLFSEIFS